MAQKAFMFVGMLALLILSFSLVSSAVDDVQFYPSSAIVSGNQGAQVTGNFNVENTLSVTDINNIYVTFQSLVLGSSTIPNTSLSFTVASTIAASQNASGTLIVNIPSNQLAGTYQGSMTLYGNTSSSSLRGTLPITLTVNSQPSLTVTQSGLTKTSNGTVTITNTGNTVLSGLVLSSLNDADFNVTFGSLGSTSLNPGQSTTASISSTNAGNLNLGEDSTVSIRATSGTVTNTGSVEIPVTYCSDLELSDTNNQLKITDVRDLSSGDDWAWSPLKDISLRVTVENNYDASKSVEVKIGLYDVSRGRFVDLTTSDRELTDNVRISDDSDEDFNFDFQLPADINQNDDYRLYVKAYVRSNEKTICTSNADFTNGDTGYYQNIDYASDDDILIANAKFPTSFFCGTSDTISFDVYNFNLGDNEKMRVRLYNSALGISTYSDQFELDEGNSESLSFDVNIPQNVTAKLYGFTLFVEYDYKDSSETYKNYFDQTYNLNVQGTCAEVVSTTAPTINAQLSSNAVVGQDLVVTVSVKNNGNGAANFIIAPTNYESWAGLVSVEPQVLTINAGSTQQAILTFNPTEAGTKTFNVQVISNGNTEERAVSVTITENKSSITNFFESLGDTTYIIAGVLVLLIILVIVLIIVAARKPRHSDF